MEWIPMADDSEKINQDEIEELLRQAQATVAPAAPSKPVATAAAQPGIAGGSTAGAVDSAFDDVQVLLDQAQQALSSIDSPNTTSPEGIARFELRDFGGAPASTEKATLDLLRDVELDLRIELGRTQMFLEEVLKLKRGAVVALDKLAGDPVDVFVNGRLIARGEVLVLNDNFCVRVTELVTGDDV